MAQQVVYLDDIDGTPGAKTVQFAIGKSVFTIDLCPANEQKLHEAVEPFTSNAHPASGAYRQAVTSPLSGTAKGTSGRARTKQERARTADIREWARTQGYEISARGRIPAEIEDKYHAAHRTSL